MSLLHPPEGFPPHLAMIWPLIWVQLLLLRAAVRAAYGKGVQYHWSVSPNGRVFLTSIDWIPSQKKERTFPKPANDRLAAACDGRLFVPGYVRFLQVRAAPVLMNTLRAFCSTCRGLPRPET